MVGNMNDALLWQLPQVNKKRIIDKNHVTCHRCGEMGHYANEIAKCKAARS